MMKLPVAALLTNLKPAVGFQPCQQLVNLDRHAPMTILLRVSPVERASLLQCASPGTSVNFESDSDSHLRFERITLAMSRAGQATRERREQRRLQ